MPATSQITPLEYQHGSLELLTSHEVAKILRRSHRQLERDRADRVGIQFLRIGARIFYRRSDVERFIEACVQPTTGRAQ